MNGAVGRRVSSRVSSSATDHAPARRSAARSVAARSSSRTTSRPATRSVLRRPVCSSKSRPLATRTPSSVGERSLHAALVAGRARAERRVDVPVPAGDEVEALPLALDDQPHRDALDAAGGQPLRDLAPEQRADRVPDQAIEDPARLLRLDEVEVELAGLLQRAPDRRLGDLVERHALDGHLRLQHLDDVPADRLALAVLIRRDVDLVRPGERLLEAAHLGLVLRRDHVVGFVGVVDVDAEGEPLGILAGLLGVRGEVAHVPHARHDAVAGAQEALDGAGLGGGLDDHEAGGPALGRFGLGRLLGHRITSFRNGGHYMDGPTKVKGCGAPPTAGGGARWRGRGSPRRRTPGRHRRADRTRCATSASRVSCAERATYIAVASPSTVVEVASTSSSTPSVSRGQSSVERQLVRPDAVHGRERPVQHVVEPLVLARALDREDVRGLLDHAEHLGVAARVLADGAQRRLALLDVRAARAAVEAALGVEQRARERLDVALRAVEQVEGEALGGLRADPRQPPELPDQGDERCGEAHALRTSRACRRGRPSPTPSRARAPLSPAAGRP